MNTDYRKKYESWLASSVISHEERAQLQAMTEKEIRDAFYKDAEFGTAGMRGKMGLGSNRLNKYTIRLGSRGLAEMLLGHKDADGSQPSVAIAYDTRNNSESFARETACVLAAAGVKVYLFDRVSPVPLLSFAVRHLGCSGGVVITASHNTKEYNGFKTYDNTGCQMQPELTEEIAANMAAVKDPMDIETADLQEALADGIIEMAGDQVVDAFHKAIAPCGMPPAGQLSEADAAALKVVYTPIHGSGRDYVLRALDEAGFSQVELLEEQAEFNGDFPTVRKPNPEDADALAKASQRALAQADALADIVIGTDPDCDRIGVGVVIPARDGQEASVRYLSGNQTGALMIDYLSRFRAEAGGELITTIVTSELGPIIARDKGIKVHKVLTGFKYIGGVMNQMQAEGCTDDYFMGYEESYGYLPGTHARDKDGVSAALVICRMAAWYKAHGRSLADALDDIYDRFGFWLDCQESLVYEGAEGEKTMGRLMDKFRELGPEIFQELCQKTEDSVSYEDYRAGVNGLPSANVLKYSFTDGSWAAVRPSGTEPKVKIYYCMKGSDEKAASERQAQTAACFSSISSQF